MTHCLLYLRVSSFFTLTQDKAQIVADHEQLQLLTSASTDQDTPRTEHVWIDNLGEGGYQILQPIPVEIQEVAPEDFLASFREANITISGSDSDDVYRALVAEILDTFDVLIEERNLGPDAAEKLRTLSTYIART